MLIVLLDSSSLRHGSAGGASREENIYNVDGNRPSRAVSKAATSRSVNGRLRSSTFQIDIDPVLNVLVGIKGVLADVSNGDTMVI